MMRIPTLATALTGALLAIGPAGAAFAQTNPSAQQIINQLKPTGSLSDTTRGIKPLPAAPVGTGMGMSGNMGMAPARPAAAEQAAAPSANLDIDFAPGSANLTPQAAASLDQLGKALTSAQLSAYNFKIVGHTDTTGSAAANQALSEQRAAAVKSYLESKFSVPASRLQSEGVGESDLLVPTPANTPEMRNRRVEVINLGK